MTKYIGESIAVRSGRRTDALLGGDRRKAMETFMKTGKHPIIEHTRQENASDALKPLPTVDHNRPHVFIDVSQRPGVSGRIVVELLEDMFPALCAAFRNRCHEGHHGVKGTTIFKVQPNFAVFGGQSNRASAESFSAASSSAFQHVDPGLLSVHEDGSHFALTIGRALPLDKEYRVIGRVGTGMDVLEKLGDVETSIDDDPVVPINIVQSGLSDYKGTGEVFGAVNTREQDTAETQKELLHASVGAKSALQDGLKRSRPEPVAAATAGPSVRKKRAMGELSSDEDDEEEED